MIATPVRAIVIVAPLLLGIGPVLTFVIGLATIPVTVISIFVNIDKYKKDKKSFFLFTLATWAAILAIIGIITAAFYYLSGISR
jgi:hypothetical protein